MLGLNHEGLKFIVIGKFSIFFSRIILYENAICHVLSIQSFALQNFFIPQTLDPHGSDLTYTSAFIQD
jgi:hypothetical protein